MDKVWMSTEAKCRAMAALANEDPNVIFIHWFDDSLNHSSSYFGGAGTAPCLYMAREAAHSPLSGKRIIFAEHYPLLDKEKEIFEKLNLEKAEVWSALDEPLLKKFGGERIIGLMQALGMKDNEIITHPMIANSIRKAQEKIAKKLLLESHASSQEEWIRKNLPA